MEKVPDVSFSIVSHGQGQLIRWLLEDIRAGVDVGYEIIITLNIPEDESFLGCFEDLKPVVIRNSARKGFGENHNAAFGLARGRYFAVLNPDIRAKPFRIAPLLDVMNDLSVGVCAPLVYSPLGNIEDSARNFPTARTLILRKMGFHRGPDYVVAGHPLSVDWVAGMFMLFRREAFARIGGFDVRFFMYLEDTDICRRLALSGFRVVLEPSVSVVHDARRASRKSIKHLAWHLSSAWRYLRADKSL